MMCLYCFHAPVKLSYLHTYILNYRRHYRCCWVVHPRVRVGKWRSDIVRGLSALWTASDGRLYSLQVPGWWPLSPSQDSDTQARNIHCLWTTLDQFQSTQTTAAMDYISWTMVQLTSDTPCYWLHSKPTSISLWISITPSLHFTSPMAHNSTSSCLHLTNLPHNGY